MTNHMHKYCSNNSDEYYTPAYAVYPILKYLKPNSTIWCPFAMLVSNAGIFESQFRFNMFANNEFEMLIFNKRVQYKTPEAGVMARPPFLSVYITSKLLPKQIVFEQLDTERSCDFK